VVGKYKVAKHFTLTISDTDFSFARKQDAIDAEARLDGIYVVRTSLSAKALDDSASVRAYKSLAQIERAIRSIKTVDLQVRPVFHWTAPRVRAHVCLCMLAYYVEWHMRDVNTLAGVDAARLCSAAARPLAAFLKSAAGGIRCRGRPAWDPFAQALDGGGVATRAGSICPLKALENLRDVGLVSRSERHTGLEGAMVKLKRATAG